LYQILQHRSKAPRDLNGRATELTNLRNRQLNEVLPIRCAINEANAPFVVSYHAFIETPMADSAKQMMNLVNRQHRRRRIVDRRRQPLCRYVDNNAKGQRGVLLVGSFLAHGNAVAESISQ